MRGTPSRRGAVPLIIMNSTPKKIIVPALVFFAFLFLCVRPADALIISARVCKLYSNGNIDSCVGNCTNAADKTACMAQLGYPNASWPLATVGVDQINYSCASPSVYNPVTLACDAPPPASSQAKSAALAAGYSAAAAQAAEDAVLAHSASPVADLASIGSTAARNYDYSTGRGLNAATAAAVAAEAANLFANNTANGFDAMQRASLADIIVGGSVDRHLARQAAGQSPSTAQLVAGIAAGALTTAAVGMAVAGAAPVSVAIAASAALHTGILAVVDTGASAQQQQAAVAAGAQAIKSGATPLQVTLAPQVVAQAVPVNATQSQITAASLAAVSAFMTSPQSSWATPAIGMPNNAASIAASTASDGIANGYSDTNAAVAAAAAANTVAGGGTVAAAVVSAKAASDYVTAGGSGAGAAVIGQQVGAQADGATEGTLKGVLGKLSDLVGFGQGVPIGDAVVPAGSADRVSVAKTSLNDSMLVMQNAAIAANDLDEVSLFGAFVFDPQYVACEPFTKTIMGKVVVIDLCSYTAKLRELLGWLFALLGAYTIYQTIFRSRV